MSGDAQTIQEQNMLIKEAQMQMDALRRLGNWQRGCLSIAVIGVILAVNGFYMNAGTLRGVFGIILAVLFSAMAKKWKREREKDSGGCSSADFRRLVKIRFIFRICESGHLEMV